MGVCDGDTTAYTQHSHSTHMHKVDDRYNLHVKYLFMGGGMGGRGV